MQIHQLKRSHPNKKSRQVGRGGKRGKTAGRGTKGQNARAGRKIRPEMRDLIKKLPKLRGRGKNSNVSIQTKPVVISLDLISKYFTSGGEVNPTTLVEKKAVKKKKGKIPAIKVLGDGEARAKFVISGVKVSTTAKEKVEKAGGTIQS